MVSSTRSEIIYLESTKMLNIVDKSVASLIKNIEEKKIFFHELCA